jgi:hypothetical protein
MEDGKKQVRAYGKQLEQRHGNLRLKKFVVVALGFERVCFSSVSDRIEMLCGWKAVASFEPHNPIFKNMADFCSPIPEQIEGALVRHARTLGSDPENRGAGYEISVRYF